MSGDAEVGTVLTEDPRVDVISFTGSERIGARVLAQAAPNINRVLLELGGKSALIVRRRRRHRRRGRVRRPPDHHPGP
ncbi:aldehyde dehydrogenase family protein [Nocardia sp. NBC_01499]|uniref:aldehyde dehydrogenase family protein n=1 Tax=Nocardia sp. NBC_01499 TaxID=2903597 RepID=UPI0038650128